MFIGSYFKNFIHLFSVFGLVGRFSKELLHYKFSTLSRWCVIEQGESLFLGRRQLGITQIMIRIFQHAMERRFKWHKVQRSSCAKYKYWFTLLPRSRSSTYTYSKTLTKGRWSSCRLTIYYLHVKQQGKIDPLTY